MAENRYAKSIKQAEDTPIEQVDTNIRDNTLENINSNTIPNTLDNILGNLIDKEQKGANFTFYLSADVADKLTMVAKQKQISKSKLVDIILRKVLFPEQY